MKDIVEIHEFFVQGSDTEKSHVLLHISEPSFEEEDKGYFFALCEIINGSNESISQIQKMIDDVESNYYDNESSGQNITTFEKSIEYINRRSHHILNNKTSKFNLLFGVIENNKIYFVSRGPILAHLLYHKAGELQHVEINEERKVPEDQIFSSLVEGEIRVNDFFVITTEAVNQYFAIDRVEKILSQKDTKAGAQHIQRTLEQVKSEQSLSGILIHRPTEENIPKLSKLPRSARPIQSSLPIAKSLLASTVATISQKLNPTTVENGIFNPQSKPVLNSDNSKHIPPKNIPRPLVLMAHGLGIATVAIVQLLRAIFRGIFKFLQFLFILGTNRRGERKQSIHNFELGIREKSNTLKRLPLVSKILLILSILALLIFTGSIIWIRHNEKQEALQKDYDNKINLIQSEKDTAERSLLYGDITSALAALQKAQTTLENLKNYTNKNETQIQELRTKIENDFKQIRKQNDVSTIQKADITSQFANAKTDKLVRLDNQLVAFNATDHSYYFINLDTGLILQKNHDTIPNLSNASSPKEYDKIVFTTDGSHIASYDKTTDSLSSQDIAFPTSNVNIANLNVYNRKLYTLDIANNQIYKHSQTQTGYDKGTPWIQESGVDIKDVISFTIDGELYALKTNGEILKFAGGKLQAFSITGLDPALKNPSQIWTYNDVKNIYILDPATKRVIVLDKNGVLVKQYTSSEWKNPTSMVVDEAAKKVYILDSNKIFEFKI